jgi:predicted transposase YdaD
MAKARIHQLVGQFLENGLKLLLEDPRNTEDLLRLTDFDLIAQIDFDRLELVRTSFVARDYRHLEADLVLRAPLRPRPGQRRKVVWIFILIEHQSEPDALMPLRLLDYVAQIFKRQVRTWQSKYGSRRRVRLQPVLPLVFYTGTQRWESVGRLEDLMELGQQFARVTPHLEPLYLNLGAMAPDRLVAQGGHFGQVLRLVQQRQAGTAEFRQLLREVVSDLERMPAQQRLRWLELLSYIRALVYHERSSREQALLEEVLEASVQTDEKRREVSDMFRSAADDLKAEGRKEGRKKGREEGRKKGREEGRKEGHKEGCKEGEVQGRRQALLILLRMRFRELPPEVVAQVERTADISQLDAWLERVGVVSRLEDVGIGSGQ